jgi:hypothetical protein
MFSPLTSPTARALIFMKLGHRFSRFFRSVTKSNVTAIRTGVLSVPRSCARSPNVEFTHFYVSREHIGRFSRRHGRLDVERHVPCFSFEMSRSRANSNADAPRLSRLIRRSARNHFWSGMCVFSMMLWVRIEKSFRQSLHR